MKLIKNGITEKDNSGFVKLQAEYSEDMWHLYNLIAPGDFIKAPTLRKVVKEGATGSTRSEKVRLSMKIEVKRVEYDPEGLVIRIGGPNVEMSQHVKMGAFHTIELELNRAFEIHKRQWDSIHLERLETACTPEKTAEVAAVIITSTSAQVCFVTPHMTITRARIEGAVPSKYASASTREKATAKFFNNVLQAVRRLVDFTTIKTVIVAGPGFTTEEWLKYALEESVRQDYKEITLNKSSFLVVKTSGGSKRSLQEALANPKTAAALADSNAAVEVKVLEEFFKMLETEPSRAYYGPREVELALERGAIDKLLIADSLFRSNDIAQRQRYVRLVEAVKDGGGKVYHFSSLHASGEQLEQITGVAAILRFPLHDLEELLDSGSDSDTDSDSDVEGGGPMVMEAKADGPAAFQGAGKDSRLARQPEVWDQIMGDGGGGGGGGGN